MSYGILLVRPAQAGQSTPTVSTRILDTTAILLIALDQAYDQRGFWLLFSKRRKVVGSFPGSHLHVERAVLGSHEPVELRLSDVLAVGFESVIAVIGFVCNIRFRDK